MLNEGALHAFEGPVVGADGQVEVSFGDFVADVLCDGVIYEIQTSSFTGLARKMRALFDCRQLCWCILFPSQIFAAAA